MPTKATNQDATQVASVMHSPSLRPRRECTLPKPDSPKEEPPVPSAPKQKKTKGKTVARGGKAGRKGAGRGRGGKGGAGRGGRGGKGGVKKPLGGLPVATMTIPDGLPFATITKNPPPSAASGPKAATQPASKAGAKGRGKKAGRGASRGRGRPKGSRKKKAASPKATAGKKNDTADAADAVEEAPSSSDSSTDEEDEYPVLHLAMLKANKDTTKGKRRKRTQEPAQSAAATAYRRGLAMNLDMLGNSVSAKLDKSSKEDPTQSAAATAYHRGFSIKSDLLGNSVSSAKLEKSPKKEPHQEAKVDAVDKATKNLDAAQPTKFRSQRLRAKFEAKVKEAAEEAALLEVNSNLCHHEGCGRPKEMGGKMCVKHRIEEEQKAAALKKMEEISQAEETSPLEQNHVENEQGSQSPLGKIITKKVEDETDIESKNEASNESATLTRKETSKESNGAPRQKHSKQDKNKELEETPADLPSDSSSQSESLMKDIVEKATSETFQTQTPTQDEKEEPTPIEPVIQETDKDLVTFDAHSRPNSRKHSLDLAGEQNALRKKDVVEKALKKLRRMSSKSQEVESTPADNLPQPTTPSKRSKDPRKRMIEAKEQENALESSEILNSPSSAIGDTSTDANIKNSSTPIDDALPEFESHSEAQPAQPPLSRPELQLRRSMSPKTEVYHPFKSNFHSPFEVDNTSRSRDPRLMMRPILKKPPAFERKEHEQFNRPSVKIDWKIPLKQELMDDPILQHCRKKGVKTSDTQWLDWHGSMFDYWDEGGVDPLFIDDNGEIIPEDPVPVLPHEFEKGHNNHPLSWWGVNEATEVCPPSPRHLLGKPLAKTSPFHQNQINNHQWRNEHRKVEPGNPYFPAHQPPSYMAPRIHTRESRDPRRRGDRMPPHLIHHSVSEPTMDSRWQKKAQDLHKKGSARGDASDDDDIFSTIIISGIPLGVPLEDIKHHFLRFGNVIMCEQMRPSSPLDTHIQVLTTYQEQSQAKCALRYFRKNIFVEDFQRYFTSSGPENISLHLSSNKAAHTNKLIGK